jgi:hypothetical protein
MMRAFGTAAAGALAAAALAAPAGAAVVEWTVASGGNGHFYEWVGVNVGFNAARTAALAATHNGMNGYLVTVTSAAENAFVYSLAGGRIGWSSGSDAETEGTWKWLDGPEAGTVFWQNGVTLTYAQWGAGEPNNFRNLNEDHMVIKFGTGFWNDLVLTEAQGYYVEYSAAPASGGVPEPGAWALMITGFGLAGAALRGRRLRAA